LGAFYPQIIRALEFIKKNRDSNQGFHDLSEKDLASLSGLSREEAASAKRESMTSLSH
jgi:hypothetical protein